MASGRRRAGVAAPRERALVEQWMDWQATEFNNAWRYAFMAKVRQSQFLPLIAALQTGGWVEAERYPGQFKDWIEQASLIGDYWMASAEIMLDGDSDYKRKHYVRLFFATLAPHLTPRGLEVYQQILADS